MLIIVGMPSEDIDTSKFMMGFGRADSANRFSENPLISSRGNSAFTLLNVNEDLGGMSRVWNSLGLNNSRPPTVQGDFNKLLTNPQEKEKEKEEEAKNELEIDKTKSNIAQSSIANLLGKEYFFNTSFFNTDPEQNGIRKGQI